MFSRGVPSGAVRVPVLVIALEVAGPGIFMQSEPFSPWFNEHERNAKETSVDAMAASAFLSKSLSAVTFIINSKS